MNFNQQELVKIQTLTSASVQEYCVNIQAKGADEIYQEIFRSTHDKVLKPLNSLLDLLEVPNKLIVKRHDKLLDYECARLNYAKTREKTLLKAVQENVYDAQKNYEALNNQLLEELPNLIVISSSMLEKCFRLYLAMVKDFHEKMGWNLKHLAADSLSCRKPEVRKNCFYFVAF